MPAHWQPKPCKDDVLSDIAHDLARLLPQDADAQKPDADIPTLRRASVRDLIVLSLYLSAIATPQPR